MAGTYKTPGVYVEEITKFPPSIAPVETAIPAFIGYTEFAMRDGMDITLKPTRIESIAEYEAWFGGEPPQAVTVTLDANNAFVKADNTAGIQYFLFDSLRMFYANGGGNCFIVSVGSYAAGILKTDILKGIDEIANEDEPTILLTPDAVGLTGTELYDVQVQALMQCNTLKDRVAVCDTTNEHNFETAAQNLRNGIGINNLKYGAAYGPWINSSLPRTIMHRDLTLVNNSSQPVLLSSLTTDAAMLQVLADVEAAETSANTLTTEELPASWDNALQTLSDEYNKHPSIITNLTGIYDLLATIIAKVSDMEVGLPVVTDPPHPAQHETRDFKLASDIAQFISSSLLRSQFDAITSHYNFQLELSNDTTKLFPGDPSVSGSNLAKAIALIGYSSPSDFLSVQNQDVATSIFSKAPVTGAALIVTAAAAKAAAESGATGSSVAAAAKVAAEAIIAPATLDTAVVTASIDLNAFSALTAFTSYSPAHGTDSQAAALVVALAAKVNSDADTNASPQAILSPTVNAVKALNLKFLPESAATYNLAKNAAMAASGAVIALYRFAQSSAAEYEKKFNDALLNSFGAYKNFVAKAAQMLNMLPPSGAIAGVYASVDRDRGVWKSPANVSLNAVIGPAVTISAAQQEEYNVDVNAGKSINIIRSFLGKGTLVWGARTLAGNDNEWRYISVRRFFNMVEESTKKATEQFVFEPNDANTWVKIQAMIENFLTGLWRQGALQGVKPEHAFYVAVGLGKTMTAIDILEGRMIIEIGMAVVRPTEFIVLKFSHKMPES